MVLNQAGIRGGECWLGGRRDPGAGAQLLGQRSSPENSRGHAHPGPSSPLRSQAAGSDPLKGVGSRNHQIDCDLHSIPERPPGISFRAVRDRELRCWGSGPGPGPAPSRHPPPHTPALCATQGGVLSPRALHKGGKRGHVTVPRPGRTRLRPFCPSRPRLRAGHRSKTNWLPHRASSVQPPVHKATGRCRRRSRGASGQS